MTPERLKEIDGLTASELRAELLRVEYNFQSLSSTLNDLESLQRKVLLAKARLDASEKLLDAQVLVASNTTECVDRDGRAFSIAETSLQVLDNAARYDATTGALEYLRSVASSDVGATSASLHELEAGTQFEMDGEWGMVLDADQHAVVCVTHIVFDNGQIDTVDTDKDVLVLVRGGAR